MLIGITGIPGSGKSTFLSFFKKKGIPTFNSDEIVKEIYKKKSILKKIKKEFPQFFKRDTFLKKDFPPFIFSKEENLKKLEEIIHPEVIKRLIRFKEKNKDKIAVAEVPLLFEKNLENFFDLTICISMDEGKALKNFSKEKKISIEEAKKRFSYQLDLKIKEKKANYVIKNNGTLLELEKKFEEIFNHLS